MKIEVLGVGFDALTLSEAAQAARALLDAHGGGCVITANPEIVLRCQHDADYAAAVNSGSLVLADGIGDIYASRILGSPLPERVAGADLVPLLLAPLAGRGGSVFLYGGAPEVARRAAEAMAREYPGLRIAGVENGYIEEETALLARLRETDPDLLLLGLGAPRQELWMQRRRPELKALMFGVGGLLDVYAGDLRRAGALWQRLGLEWLYRLYQQPGRITRMARLPRILLLAAAERARRQ